MDVVRVYVLDAEAGSERAVCQVCPHTADNRRMGVVYDTALDRSSSCRRMVTVEGPGHSSSIRRVWRFAAAAGNTLDADVGEAEAG